MFETENFFEIPQFINSQEVSDLRDEFVRLSHHFVDAKVGSSKQLNKHIRSDEICWIDDAMIEISTPLKKYFARLEELKQLLNEKYFFGLKAIDSHFAIYRPGSFYQRHVDRSSEKPSRRKISVICYLNPAWKASHGGCLRIFRDDQSFIDIEPLAGKLVAFLSEATEHEVLPAFAERFSLTSWFLDCF